MDSPVPSFLPVRLGREFAQLGGSCLAVVLLAMFALPFLSGLGEANGWVGGIAGVIFAVGASYYLWPIVRWLAARGIKKTVVELSAHPLRPGEITKICLIQPGPFRLQSLRADLVYVKRRHHARRACIKPDDQILSRQTLVEAQNIGAVSGHTWHEVGEFFLPSNAPLARDEGEYTWFWRIEVCGEGYGLASFNHLFPVSILHEDRPQEEDDTDEDDL